MTSYLKASRVCVAGCGETHGPHAHVLQHHSKQAVCDISPMLLEEVRHMAMRMQSVASMATRIVGLDMQLGDCRNTHGFRGCKLLSDSEAVLATQQYSLSLYVSNTSLLLAAIADSYRRLSQQRLHYQPTL